MALEFTRDDMQFTLRPDGNTDVSVTVHAVDGATEVAVQSFTTNTSAAGESEIQAVAECLAHQITEWQQKTMATYEITAALSGVSEKVMALLDAKCAELEGANG